jgi:peptide/nickel transport system permease protein
MSVFRRFLTRWQNILALLIIGFFVFVALAAPWLSPQEDPENPSPYRIYSGSNRSSLGKRVPQPPDGDIPLGTAPQGLDIYHAMVWGTGPALRFGLIVALSSAVIGTLIGSIGGYLGGRTNGLVMRFTDAFLAFPALAGVFLFQQLLLPPSTDVAPTAFQQFMMKMDVHPVMLALILFSWMPFARIINANVTILKGQEFVLAAKTLGAQHWRIILSHLLPNGIAPLIVMVARDIGAMVILEASFTFIGVSGYLPWGVILVTGRDWIIGPGGSPLLYWWVFLPATLALILFGIGWNLLGDGLNVALNPKSANR